MSCSNIPPADAPDPLRIEDRWLTETVVALARGIATDLKFDRLPILADALEDAGADNFTLLNELRGDGLHSVGCWALRRLLRTTLMLPRGVPITFAYCPPGSFLMGSNHGSDTDWGNERPVHQVTLTNGYYISVHPVTGRQQHAATDLWERYQMSEHPGPFSWHSAQSWCDAMRAVTGVPFRLPTEAEWEYACRAGTATDYSTGDTISTDQANCFAMRPGTTRDVRADWQPRPVGSFPANPWGLFDMHGNIWEWCQDWYDAEYYKLSPQVDPSGPEDPTALPGGKVIRGGSYNSRYGFCRSAARGGHDPDGYVLSGTGLRVVFTAG